jgi:hypothetical protein
MPKVATPVFSQKNGLKPTFTFVAAEYIPHGPQRKVKLLYRCYNMWHSTNDYILVPNCPGGWNTLTCRLEHVKPVGIREACW